MSEKKKKKHKKRNRFASFFLKVGIIACAAVIGISGYKLVTTYMEYREGEEEYERLKEYAPVEPTPTPAEEAEEEETEEAVEEPIELEEYFTYVNEDDMRTRRKPPVTVDWKSLKEINEDIVGWLYIGALNISYPVVQGEDDDYYLHRTFERQDNFAGSIFVEAENSPDFTDPNTIIYGHNMMNKSMFGSLSDLTDKDRYKRNRYFWIMTPNGNYRYRMISIHVTGVTSDVYTLFTGTDRDFVKWCQKMKGLSAVAIQDETFTEHSKIVTLSTCTTDSARRYVVQGMAVRD